MNYLEVKTFRSGIASALSAELSLYRNAIRNDDIEDEATKDLISTLRQAMDELEETFAPDSDVVKDKLR